MTKNYLVVAGVALGIVVLLAAVIALGLSEKPRPKTGLEKELSGYLTGLDAGGGTYSHTKSGSTATVTTQLQVDPNAEVSTITGRLARLGWVPSASGKNEGACQTSSREEVCSATEVRGGRAIRVTTAHTYQAYRSLTLVTVTLSVPG